MKYLITILVSTMLALAFFSFPAPPGRGIASCWDSTSSYQQNVLLEGQLLQGVQDEAFQKSAGEYRAFLLQLQVDAMANRAAIRGWYGLNDGAFNPHIYQAMPTIVPFNPQNSHSIFAAQPQTSSLVSSNNQLPQWNQLF